MQLSEVECIALVELLIETIEASRYPLSPRIRVIKVLRGVRRKIHRDSPARNFRLHRMTHFILSVHGDDTTSRP
jgi:hypothetical protein